MKKYLMGLGALAIAAVSVVGTLQAKSNFATTFRFLGTTEAQYTNASFWKVYNPSTDPDCEVGDRPCQVSHASITTPAALAAAINAASGTTVEQKMSNASIAIEDLQPLSE